MCDPTGGLATMALVSTAVAGASSIVGFMGQGQKYSANVQAADQNFANTQNTLATQATQVDAQHSEDAVSNVIAAAQQGGRISSLAGSLGASGAETAGLENAADFAAGRSQSLSDRNTQNKMQQVGQDSFNAYLTRQSQINQVAAPNADALALSLTGDAASGFSQYTKVGGKL